MITVLTRLYRDEASARGVVGRLYRAGFPRNTVSLIANDQSNLSHRIERALVPEPAAGILSSLVSTGRCLVIVRATYKPLNAVRIAKETFETSGAVPSGLEAEVFRVKAPKDHAPSVLKDHPKFLTMDGSVSDGPKISEQIGLRLLSPRKRRASVIPGGKLFFGDAVLRRRTRKTKLPTGKFMSRTFWPMPLLSKRKDRRSVIPDGGHPLSSLMGWPLTSRD